MTQTHIYQYKYLPIPITYTWTYEYLVFECFLNWCRFIHNIINTQHRWELIYRYIYLWMYSVEIIHCCVCVWNPWHGGIRIHSVQASLDTCKWIGFRDQRDDCKGHVRDRFVCDEDVNIYFKMHMHTHTQLIHHYKYIPKYTHTHIWHNYQSIINTCKNLPTHTHWRKYCEHLLLYTYVHVQMPPHNHHNRYVWKYTHTHIFGNTHTHTHWHN